MSTLTSRPDEASAADPATPRSTASRVFRNWWPLIGLVIPLAAVVALLSTAPLSVQSAGTGGLVNLVMVVGLYIFIGNSGVQSFGHIAFVAVGAYASALLTIPLANRAFVLPNLPPALQLVELPFVASIVVAAIVAGVVALVAAVPLMKLSGIAAGIATFALLIIVQNVAGNWTDVTGGLGTLTGVPVDLTLWPAFLCAVVAMLVAFVFSRSRFGARLRASRDDIVAARAIGVRVERERRIAFVLSAMVMGAAGALYAHRLGSFGPGDFYIALTFTILAMLIVGGARSLAGAVSGAVVLTVIDEVLSRWQSGQAVGPIAITLPTGTSALILAIIMIIVLIFRPAGITNSRELIWPFGSRRRPGGTK